MMILPTTHVLALTLFAPAATMLPAVTPLQAQATLPAEVATLHARFDPSLESLRAGSVVTPASIGAQERAELSAAQQRSTSLDALRAGDEPTHNEWKWLAIGAAIILLIVLL